MVLVILSHRWKLYLSFEIFFINFSRYFRQGDYYGAACFEKLTINSDIERGARMKSIGVIVSSFNALHHHLEYLAQHVR